jgi:hypothetical protein
MRASCVLAAVILAIGLTTQSGIAAGVDNPSIQALLTMIEEGAEEEEILDRAEEIGTFPQLDGHDLAELKRRGMSDAVLLKIIELSMAAPTPKPPRETPAASDMTPADRGMIRVTLEYPFPITFYEVVLDKRVVHAEGKLWEGSVGPGLTLDPPEVVGHQTPKVVLETPVAPGRHTTLVGFAVSEVRADPSETWGEPSGEHYETRGILATDGSLAGQAPAGNPGGVCVVEAGHLCEVYVTPQRTSSSVLGGASVYSVRYRVRVVGPAGDEEEN